MNQPGGLEPKGSETRSGQEVRNLGVPKLELVRKIGTLGVPKLTGQEIRNPRDLKITCQEVRPKFEPARRFGALRF